MATGSPTGPGWCPSEHAGGALLGARGGRKVGGRQRRPGAVQSPPDVGSHLIRSPTWKKLGPTTRLPPRGPEVSPTHSSCQASRPVVVPGDPECTVNTLRPARCPRKCWAAAKPRPAPPARVFGNCPQATSLAPLPPLRGPLAFSRSSGYDATHVGPGPPTVSHTVHVGWSPLGCTLSDLGMLGLSGGLPNWNPPLPRVGIQVPSVNWINWLCSLRQVS